MPLAPLTPGITIKRTRALLYVLWVIKPFLVNIHCLRAFFKTHINENIISILYPPIGKPSSSEVVVLGVDGELKDKT